MAKSFYVGVNNIARKGKKLYVGVNGIAQKVKKAYVGVANVARLFFTSSSGPSYYNSTTLSSARSSPGAVTFKGYSFFAGGTADKNGNTVGIVDAFNSSFTRTTLEELTITSGSARPGDSVEGTTLSDYALFIYKQGGAAYNQSLTKTAVAALDGSRESFSAGSTSNYAIYGGGYNPSNGSRVADAAAYNNSLTKSVLSNLAEDRASIGSAMISDCVIFAGGYNGKSTPQYDPNSNKVDYYNNSLTHSMCESLTTSQTGLMGGTVGNYAIFAGGKETIPVDYGSMIRYSTQSKKTVEAYDTSFTHLTNITPLTNNMSGSGHTTLGDYWMTIYDTNVEFYDKSLTHSVTTYNAIMSQDPETYARDGMAPTVFNNYALFGGGRRMKIDSSGLSYTFYNTVDILTIEQ